MPAQSFGLYTALGCIPWTAALGIAGYALGANWQQVADDFHGPTYAIAGLIAIAIAAAVIMHVRRRRAAGPPAPGAHPAGAQVAGARVAGMRPPGAPGAGRVPAGWGPPAPYGPGSDATTWNTPTAEPPVAGGAAPGYRMPPPGW
jgi:hypothetical protein